MSSPTLELSFNRSSVYHQTRSPKRLFLSSLYFLHEDLDPGPLPQRQYRGGRLNSTVRTQSSLSSTFPSLHLVSRNRLLFNFGLTDLVSVVFPSHHFSFRTLSVVHGTRPLVHSTTEVKTPPPPLSRYPQPFSRRPQPVSVGSQTLVYNFLLSSLTSGCISRTTHGSWFRLVS